MNDELERIKQKKLHALQEQLEEQQQQQAVMDKEIKNLEKLIKTRLDKQAITRYGNVKLAHPETAMRLLGLLIQLLEKNPEKTFSDEDVKRLLIMLQNTKTSYTIKRK